MKKIALTLLIAALLLAMMAIPAVATIHELSKAECSEGAGTQDPPGLTPGGPDRSKAEVAQPLRSANSNAFKSEECSAPQK